MPGLILENHRQVYRFHKGLLRKKMKTKYKEEEEFLASMRSMEEYKEALKDERCILQIQE